MDTSDSHKKGKLARSRTFRKWRKLSLAKKLGIPVALLVVLAVTGYAVSWLNERDNARPGASQNPPAEKKATLAELLANHPADSASVDEKIAYYDKLTLAYGEQGKYDKALETFATREGISTKGLMFQDYLNLAQYQFRTGQKEAALVALDRADAALRSDPNLTNQDKEILSKHLEGLRKGYIQ